MVETEIFAEIQNLHNLIRARYGREEECVLVNPTGPDKNLMARVQIHLGTIFSQTKEGRESRLDTMSAILPIMKPGHIPLDLDSTNRLWLAELRALN